MLLLTIYIHLLEIILIIEMDDFLNVTKKDPQIRNKINDTLDRHNGLHCNYQLKTGCDSLIQNVKLKELINIMGTTKTDLDKEIKTKISRKKCLKNKKHI